MNINDKNIAELKAQLLGSLLFFTQTFFKLRTGRDFNISCPIAREPHVISICRELTKVLYGETKKIKINIPPRYSKSELLIHFVAWGMAHYPDSNFLYISYSHNLAATQTAIIRDIISLPHYRKLFDVSISDVTSAKDNFKTTAGGSVYGVGAGGTITGRGAGIRGVSRFGGAMVLDDMHKPDEAQSDVMRQSVINWYDNTAQSRLNNGAATPQVAIGQVTHETDLMSFLVPENGWKELVLPALDSANNALDPSLHDKETLLKMQAGMPYVFAAQYQQRAQPAGGGLFKPEWFVLLDNEPDIKTTFITVDTAETDKTYNDATVFSFWGIYEIEVIGAKTGMYALHWLDCREIWIEPKDLQQEFLSFYRDCLMYKVKPSTSAIERKSTGTTLISTLNNIPGIGVLPIERNASSGSKMTRFIEIQSIVSNNRISLPKQGKHTNMCVEHCKKITANDTHARDDIADTLADAVKIALIDGAILRIFKAQNNENNKIVAMLANKVSQIQRLKGERKW